jgi:hypothetical protein|tara:strand:+ start:390 stop:725 length:336 start_codon:yes stop_codon:yes gene_type:complete
MKKTNKKEKIIESLEKTMGIVHTACQMSNVSRATFYRWVNEDKEFAEKVNEIKNYQLDFVESKLLKNIGDGKETSIIFYLKTKGRDRGYSENLDITSKGEKFNEIKVHIVK